MLLLYYISNRHQSPVGTPQPKRRESFPHSYAVACRKEGTRHMPNAALTPKLYTLTKGYTTATRRICAHSSLTWPTRNNGSQRLDPQVLCALGAMGAPYRKGDGAGAGAGAGAGGCWRGWWMGKVWRKRDTGAAGAEFVRRASSY
jgi:hypothetical protein